MATLSFTAPRNYGCRPGQGWSRGASRQLVACSVPLQDRGPSHDKQGIPRPRGVQRFARRGLALLERDSRLGISDEHKSTRGTVPRTHTTCTKHQALTINCQPQGFTRNESDSEQDPAQTRTVLHASQVELSNSSQATAEDRMTMAAEAPWTRPLSLPLGGEWSPFPRQNSGSSSSECEVADVSAAGSPTVPAQASPGSTAGATAAKQAKVLQALFSGPPRRGRRFKGVRHRKWGKFVCEIRDAIGKRIWLGSYDSEEQAARVYDAAARILQGDCAYLNFPNQQGDLGDSDPEQLPRATVKQLLQHRQNVVHRLQAGSLLSSQSRQGPASPSSNPISKFPANLPCATPTCLFPVAEGLLTWERHPQQLHSQSLETPLPPVEDKAVGPSPATGDAVAEEAGDWILKELLREPTGILGTEGDDFLPALQALASEMDQETPPFVPDAMIEGASGVEEEQLIANFFGGWDPSSLWQHQGLGTVRVVELAQ